MDKSRISFRMDPQEQYAAFVEAWDQGLELVAVFHSHPAPPVPSQIDLDCMKNVTAVWLIMSMPSEDMKAYFLSDDEVLPVKIISPG